MTHATSAGITRPRAARRGATLVELTVAILILSVGVLALAGSTGAAARTSDEAYRLELAAVAARSRLENLAALACDSTAAPAASGAQDGAALQERWTVTGTGRRKSIRVAVTVRGRAVAREIVLGRTVACRP
jgi:Tfp pilus assembly protein PilV